MLTLYARKVSEAKCITKITRMGFSSVINSLDLGSVIYPRYITSEAIIAYVRAKKESMEAITYRPCIICLTRRQKL